jgi:hypothetical protein
MSNTMSNEQHSNRVAGGYKATLNNPNASEEAKRESPNIPFTLERTYSPLLQSVLAISSREGTIRP